MKRIIPVTKPFKKSWSVIYVNGLFQVANSTGKPMYSFGNLDKDIPEAAELRAKKLARKYNLLY